MKPQRFDEVEPDQIVLGRVYLVPSVGVIYRIAGYDRGEWAPVIGDWHADPELGANFSHIHYDRRFIPNKRLSLINPASIINQDLLRPLKIVTDDITWKPQPLCRLRARDSIDLALDPPRNCPPFNPESKRRWMDLEDRHAGDRLSECRRCPHRGFDLRHIPADENGVIVCPGHWLKWRADTGELVRRWEE